MVHFCLKQPKYSNDLGGHKILPLELKFDLGGQHEDKSSSLNWIHILFSSRSEKILHVVFSIDFEYF